MLGWRSALAVVLAAALAASGLRAQSPVGVWNIQSDDMTARATGGVRVVLLRVEQSGGAYEAEITRSSKS